MRMLLAPAVLSLAVLGLAVSPTAAQPPQLQSPGSQGDAIAQALDWYCSAWMKRGVADAPPPTHTEGAQAGWRESASAKPAIGPIVWKNGAWGRASLVRVAQADGHRCSISMQLVRDGWTTDEAHAAVTGWIGKAWPDAFKAKDRMSGPRNTRETIWNSEGDMTLTLQESPEAGAQPNIFITLMRQNKDGKAI